ncbi:hypothetical protein Goari_014908 [Gossypium aridum]|uniref:Uncharacterized protein n=1 Tax=Gossypium aridum TaxID=34290 RepID=A0A7J8XJD0_GOSAI|nr:hypothetical protein [Gossypium aridum]
MTTSKGALPHYAPNALPGSANQSNLLPTDTLCGQGWQALLWYCHNQWTWVFNDADDDDLDLDKNQEEAEKMLKKYRLTAIDFIHACCSLTLFLVLACSSFNLQGCFFPE